MQPASVSDAYRPDRATLGAEGNERLIAWAGAAVLVGFAVEGLTLLTGVKDHLKVHMLVGIALLIPTGLKVAATAYRFVRYYTNSPAYVRQGPPAIVLRIIAPLLVLNTGFLLLSGLSLPLAGSYRHLLEELHKLSFWTWLVLAGIHVLWYLWRVPLLMIADLAARGTFRGAAIQRIAVVTVSGLAGCGLALALFPWVRDFVTG
jgi:hypothetical protein